SRRPGKGAEHEAPDAEPRESKSHRDGRLDERGTDVPLRAAAEVELAFEDRGGRGHEPTKHEHETQYTDDVHQVWRAQQMGKQRCTEKHSRVEEEARQRRPDDGGRGTELDLVAPVDERGSDPR